MTPALFFFLKFHLATQGCLWFHVDFRIALSISMINAIGILVGIALSI